MKNIFTAIIAIILFAAIASGVIFYAQLNQQRLELSSIKERVEIVNEQIAQTKGKIVNLKQENEILKQSIFESENQISSYNSQISSLKNNKEQILYKLQNKRSQLVSLEVELKNLVSERNSLTSELNNIISKRQYVNDEIIKLSQTKKQFEEDLKKYIKPEEGIELERIVVKLSQVSKGSILEINEKYGFAIVDAGAEDGIIVGDVLDVYRIDKLVSKVVVEKVFENFSSIVPAEGFTDVGLKVSDKVSLIR